MAADPSLFATDPSFEVWPQLAAGKHPVRAPRLPPPRYYILVPVTRRDSSIPLALTPRISPLHARPQVCDLPLCTVYLNDDRTWPWLVLVPRVPGAVEIHDLEDDDQAQLMAEQSACARAIVRAYSSFPTAVAKVNVGAIGCVCRQLHVHVLGRFVNDPAWPGPVWGATEPVPYEPEARAAFVRAVCESLAEQAAERAGRGRDDLTPMCRRDDAPSRPTTTGGVPRGR